MAGPLIGNPQDILTTPYGYTGQMAPETAIKEQALNRRRLIANMLMQRGMQQGPGGKMVGRFYVADSPMQGGANLAATLGGVLGSRAIDSQQDEAMTADRQMVVDAINAHKAKLNPQFQSPAESSGIPASALQSQGAPPVPPQPLAEGMPPRPEGPYQGEVGAVPMPGAGVQSGPPAIQLPLSDGERHQWEPGTQAPGLSKEVTPGDMNQFLPPSGGPFVDSRPPQPPPPAANTGGPFADSRTPPTQGPMMEPAPPAEMVQPPVAPPPQPVQAPAPAPPAARFVEPPGPRKPTMDDLADLLTHQHPQVRAYGAMLAQQMQKEQERTAQQEFLSAEKGLDRDVRREGILENSRMREAQMQNTMALTQMQIEARMQQGQDANELKASLAKQANELQKLQIQTAAEMKKAEIGSRADLAKSHDETLKTIAGLKQQSRGQLPAPALKMQNEELDAIGTASSIKADMASIRSQIESGKLKLGPMSNLAGQAKNYLGMSDDNSRNLASFKASLEKMRNESLRLNKGVQTEGDAVRAWDELVANMNDPKLVQQRLSEIEAMNDRAVTLRRMNIDSIRQNYGVEPLDTTGYQQQPAAVGGNKGGGPAKVTNENEYNALPSGTTYVGPDGKTRTKK